MDNKERILKSFEKSNYMEQYDIKPSDLKYKTPDDVRIALGLKPWNEFAIETIQRWSDDEYMNDNQKQQYIRERRGTGKTTKMLVQAVFKSQTQTVYIAGYNKTYTLDLVFAAREICNQLELNGSKIQPTPPNGVADFVDHYRRKANAI